ncbi:MAG: TetR/AcrR family transcriptional regulator [Myxococcaceae bacterium]
MTTRPPATRRGQRTRQQLLEAAAIVFADKGFEGASIVDITQGAGVALGTFYVYFRNKKAAYTELVDELGSRVRRSMAEAVEGLSDRIEIERAGFRAYFEFAAKNRSIYRILRQAEFVDDAVYQNYYRRIAEGYTRGLKAAMDAGQIRRQDPEKLAYCLMGIADFVGMRWVLWDGEAQLRQLVDEIMEFVGRGVIPPPPKDPTAVGAKRPRSR